MRLRPLELARPIVLVALVVSVATASSSASVSAQQWPEQRGQGVCYSQLGWCPLTYQGRVNPYFNLHPPPVPTQIK